MKSRWTTCWGFLLLVWVLGACNPYYHSDHLPDLCRGKDAICHKHSLKTWKAFLRGTGLDGISVPGIYCGTCFYEGGYYDPHYPHRGIVLIDQTNGRRYFDALFSFFSEENPCRIQSIDSIRKAMHPTLYAADHELNWSREIAWTLLNPNVESDQIIYYLRKDRSDDERIFLIGVWNDKNHRVFCRLKKSQ